MNVMIVIPAFNPDSQLCSYVKELRASGFQNILIVDDGSNAKSEEIIRTVVKSYNCILFRHAVNMGKGRALKDALNFCAANYPELDVITVDSDGQHTVPDVIKVKDALEMHPDSVVFGCRDFDSENVPFKSSFGNKLTRTIMKLLHGGNVSDTQTGLIGIPKSLIHYFLTISGERFEYETAALIDTLRRKIPITEVKIETIYYDNNAETHFRPLADSFKIYKVIFKSFFSFAISSMMSSFVDLSAFYVLTMLLKNYQLASKVWISTVIARVLSSMVNYLINKNIVFKSKGYKSIIRYYLLVILQMSASASFVYCLCKLLGLPEVYIKIFVDIVLFFISYKIQKKLVF